MVFSLSPFIFTFIQSCVFVLIDYTNFCVLADYDFIETFTLQRIVVRILIMISVWTRDRPIWLF